MRGSARLLPSRLPTGGHSKDSTMPPFDTGYAASERRRRKERRQDLAMRVAFVIACALAGLAVAIAVNL